MGVFYFPSNFVFWKNIEKHDEIKKIFMEKINSNTEHFSRNDKGLYNASTSYDSSSFDILSDVHPDIINEILWKPIDEAIKEYNSNPDRRDICLRNSTIGSAWHTKYEIDGNFNFHTHYGPGIIQDNKIYMPSFSLIYILQDENEHNSTVFTEPTQMHISSHIELESKFFTQDVPDIKEGTVIVFPSTLYHKVAPVKKPGRITIAINVCSI